MRDEILSSHAKVLNARADAFDDYRASTRSAERATPTRAQTTLDVLERERGRARASALGEVDHVTPVLTREARWGDERLLGRVRGSNAWRTRERIRTRLRRGDWVCSTSSSARADEIVRWVERRRRRRSGREARRDACEPAWRLTPSAFGRTRETSGLDNRAIVYRGYGETTMGATQSAGMRDGSMEKDVAFGGAATLKRLIE